MKRWFFICLVMLASGTQGFAQQYLNVYQDKVVIKQISTTEIDSISVTETEPRIISMWSNGDVCFTYTSEEIDSITVTSQGGPPFSYIGIVGFNDQLYVKDIGILSKSTADNYKSFVNGLSRRDGTLLYYAVDNALDMLDNANIKTPLKNVSLITFTDGLDQGSLMMTDKYDTSYEYLDALSKRIISSKVNGIPVNAYSVGLRGNDVTNVSLFKQNLRDLASSEGNSFELSNISGLREQLKTIADQIISVSNRQTISLKIPGVDSGTRERFTFDGKAAESSQLYIDGTFNRKDLSLHDVTYHGLKATSGTMVQGTQDGIFVTYTFMGLRLESGSGLIPTSNIQHYYQLPSASSWQKNTEFGSNKDTQTIVSRSGASIFLILDCSSSLGSDFSKIQQYSNEFIDLVANNAEPFSMTSPTNVTVSLDENEWVVNVSWDAVKYAEYYSVYRSNSSNGWFERVADSLTVTSWRDESPRNGSNYYRVYAMGHGLTSSASKTSSVVKCEIAAPTNVIALMDENEWAIDINWDAVKYAEYYSVYRSRSGSGFTKVADSLTVAFWRDESPLNGSNYYRVYAMGHGLTSPASNTSSVVKCEMAAPTNVIAVMEDNEMVVNVSWDAVKYAEYYSVYRSSSLSSEFTKVADSLTVTFWRDESALNGSNYYRVYAMGHGLTSAASQIVIVLKGPLCPDDHHPHKIDLGLPSGTLWSCCNVDTDHPENQSPTNYGGYYAWGEIETKNTYNESTYKYYQNGSYMIIGDIAGTQYDVAHVKWGGSWQMPSLGQQTELFNNCTYKWTTENGVKGCKLTSNKNGASIFLPAAGCRWNDNLGDVGSGCRYWSSTDVFSPYISGCAYYLCFYFESVNANYYSMGRSYGQSVRPVSR